jgi:hypothetical protein
MNRRWLSSIVLAAVAAIVMSSALVAQTTKTAAAKPSAAAPAKAAPARAATTAAYVKKTPWGDPDLQGVWNDATSTPLQRPAGKGETVNGDEANLFEEQLANDLSRDRRDGGPEVDVNRAYNEHWMDARRLKITNDRRTSLIVDPPDGRLPPTVPISAERQKIRAERQAAGARFQAGMPNIATEMSLPIRCIIRTDSPPYLPTIYNNDFQIYQSPGYVVIQPEMIHSARIIPLDGRPHIGPTLKQWLGDTRGRFEGNTLVIETTNFRNDDTVYQGANPPTYKITERFTRVADDSINYEFTIEDPTTWTKPWTAVVPWNKIDPKEQMYEYMCHEDNFDIVHLLSGARAREKNPSLNLTKPQTQR